MISLGEGSTPLLRAPRLSELPGPTLAQVGGVESDGVVQGSRDDRRRLEGGRGRCRDVIVASTGNTASSAAAYAARAGIAAVVLDAGGHRRTGKVAQSRMFGARVLEVRGDFDEALDAARELAAAARTSSSTRSTRTGAKARRPPSSRSSRSSASPPDGDRTSRTAVVATRRPTAGDHGAREHAIEIYRRGAGTGPDDGDGDPDRRSRARATAWRDPAPRSSRSRTTRSSPRGADLAAIEGLFCEPSSAAGLAPRRSGTSAAATRRDCRGDHHRSRPQGRLRPPTGVGALAPPGRRSTHRQLNPDAIVRRPALSAPQTTVIVRAPATSANIGAGFDTAAVAFDLWNDLEVTDGEES